MNKYEKKSSKYFLGMCDAIHKCYEAAAFLCDDGKFGESTVFLCKALEKTENLFGAVKSANDPNYAELLEKLAQRCKSDNVWVLNRIPDVKKWAENYEEMTEDELRKLGIKDIFKKEAILIDRLRRCFKKRIVPSEGLFRKNVIRTGVAVLVILVAIGITFGVILWKGRPVHVRQILDKANVLELKNDGTEFKSTRGHHEWLVGEESWQKVARTYMTSGGKERVVVWAHPIRDSVLVIMIDHYRIRKNFIGYAGFSDEAVESSEGSDIVAPVEFEILINDEQVYSASILRKKRVERYKRSR